MKVRTEGNGRRRKASPKVAIPIPSGEGQNALIGRQAVPKGKEGVSQYLYLLVKVRTQQQQQHHCRSLARPSQYLYLLVKVRTIKELRVEAMVLKESQYLYLLVKVRTTD